MPPGSPEFTHLHVHSEYSLLDGLSRLKGLVGRAKELGMKHLALTDHGVMYGIVDFYEAAQAAGVKPILGCEIYLAQRGMQDRDPKIDRKSNHLTLLARNEAGYRNLMQLVTKAHCYGFHYKPRVDHETLAQHAEGLIALSGCPSGELATKILEGNLDGAYKVLSWYREVFGDENYYLEIQDHGMEVDLERTIARGVSELAHQTGLPLVATNDVHYVNKKDADIQDTLLCIQTKTLKSDAERMRMSTSEYYLKSAKEMSLLFKEIPQALRTSLDIAERCQVELEFGQAMLPNYEVPEGYTQESYLRYLCQKGLEERYSVITPVIQQRLDYEFHVISSKGFVPYFLVVWDFVSYARRQGIAVGLGRGSVAGSLVSYVLNITGVDPLHHGLIFERFLNPERKSMPDIDMDFADDRRDEVIAYVANKYGSDKVAQIITFGTMAAKASVKNVGRALGMPISDVTRVTKLIPTGPHVTLKDTIDNTRELKQIRQEEGVKELLELAINLEGSISHASTHAAGVVISRDPLTNYSPLQPKDMREKGQGQRDSAKSGDLLTQYHAGALEKLGLLKMDFLGLSHLTILQNAVRFIFDEQGFEINLEKLPLDDAKTYELLASGETVGIFQLESQGMRRYIKELRPTEINDIIAMVALYRPGPMDMIPTFIKAKHGEIPIVYLHPKLKLILEGSYGVIVYQDQVLLIAIELAGFTWGEVDTFRKAMGKKKREEMEKQREKFIAGCVQGGIEEHNAADIFAQIEPFAGYGFNKAHAACYAVAAYQTAYLKANYPAEFMAAVLTTEMSNTAKIVSAIIECRRLGVPVLPPDVNRSQTGFSVEAEAIRFGLLSIKSIGSGPVDAIFLARQDGTFSSLADFCARVDSKKVPPSRIESLIKAGACDSLAGEGGRCTLLAALDQAIALGERQRRDEALGQTSLFGAEHGQHSAFSLPAQKAVLDWWKEQPGFSNLPSQKQILTWEKEQLGLYLSAHPLTDIATQLSGIVTAFSGDLNEELNGKKVTMAGIITDVQRKVTKRKETMLVVQLEDLQGITEVLVFPKLYEQSAGSWLEDTIVVVNGVVDSKDEYPKLLADFVREYHAHDAALQAALRPTYLMRITFTRTGNDLADTYRVQDLSRLLQQHPGGDHFELYVFQPGEWKVRLNPHDSYIRYSPELLHAITDLLGEGAVQVEQVEPVPIATSA